MFKAPKFLNIYTECFLCFTTKKLCKSLRSNTEQSIINCENNTNTNNLQDTEIHSYFINMQALLSFKCFTWLLLH